VNRRALGSSPRWRATYHGAKRLSPLVHADGLRVHRHGRFTRDCCVSVLDRLAGWQSLKADRGECLWQRFGGCPLFNSQPEGRPNPTRSRLARLRQSRYALPSEAIEWSGLDRTDPSMSGGASLVAWRSRYTPIWLAQRDFAGGVRFHLRGASSRRCFVCAGPRPV
jgi:hypothetical protein